MIDVVTPTIREVIKGFLRMVAKRRVGLAVGIDRSTKVVLELGLKSNGRRGRWSELVF